MLTTHRPLTAQGNRGASLPTPPHQRQRPAVRFVSMSVLSVCLLVASSVMPTTSWAEERKHTVQSGENLNKIVRKYYPDLDKREQRAMMQQIVDENPKGFIGNSANGLKLGAELVLPADPNAEPTAEEETDKDESDKSPETQETKDKEEKPEPKEETKTESKKQADETDDSDKDENELDKQQKEKNQDDNDKAEEKAAQPTDKTSDKETKETEKTDDNDDKNKNDSAASDETDTTQITQLKSQNEQLEALLEKYEAEIEILQAKSASDQKTDSADTEALKAQVEQLTALAEKYEIENEALKEKLDSGSANDSDKKASGDVVATGDDDIESLKAQVEQLTALAEKYETELDELKEQGSTANNTTANTDDSNGDADITTLKTTLTEKEEQIAQLKTQVSDYTKANADLSRQLAEAESNLVLKWVLGGVALFALLFGFYVISSRLRKRADEAAAEELKSVMASAEAAVEKSLDDKDPEEDNFEADIKLDIAKAYLELNNSFAAHEILQEVLREGSTSQQTKAQKLMEQIQ